MSFKLRLICVVIITLNITSATFLFNLGESTFQQQYKSQRISVRDVLGQDNLPNQGKYDFVVIGSGPGGSAVASRLSEIADWKVLLLEAGKDGSILTDIPAIVANLQFTDYNWGYKMERAEGVCLAMKEQRCPWPRGKGLGGTSLINYMIYTRGQPKDYDLIEAAGNPGWGYKNVLHYYMKSEKINIDEYMNSSVHSRQGYLDVERVPYKTKVVDVFIKACNELGYDNIDYNAGRKHEGASRVQATLRSGRRVSAAKAYLEPIKQRPNLHISVSSRVTKIIIDPTTKRAIGVEFVKNRKRRVVYVKKEVILSAGSLNSPQLLMLSGVGPKEHLESYGIPVIKDLPVGKNLQEHFTMPGLVFVVNNSDTIVQDRDLNLPNLLKWYEQGAGIFTIPGGVEGINYLSTKYNKEPDLPDLELLFIAGSLVSDNGKTVKDSFGVTDEFYNSVYSSINNKNTISIFPILLKPKSRGYVLLQDKNPWHWPLFYHNYFNKSADMDLLVEGIKKVLELQQTDAFKSINASLHSVPFPGCTHLTFASDDYWACAARTLPLTLHHQCCTCKMGPSSDPSAVVDSKLLVHGIKGLRVVDASIFPEIPTAHLYAPTLMVGEKAADMIKDYWLPNRSRT